MIKKLEKLLFYGNIDKKTFDQIYPIIVQNSRKNLMAFSLIVVLTMGIMTIVSFFTELLAVNRTFYLICFIFNLFLFLIMSKTNESNKILVFSSIYAFIALLFGFGIALGTFVEPDMPTVSFLVILFAVPLLFTDIPIRMNLCILSGIIVYTIIAKMTQSSVIFDYNMASILPYGIISMVVSTYMMTIKIHRFALESENRYLSESDQLTGMLNRRCYEQKLDSYRQAGCHNGMMICAFDVNGLKKVNDHLGHIAGDELLKGAASCIENVFSSYGSCYRIGGDEFIALLEKVHPSKEELKEHLEARTSQFRGNYASHLSISVGMVEIKDGDIIDEVIREVDKKLYEDKANYYMQNHIDRRRRQ